jgi:hypothetical protein
MFKENRSRRFLCPEFEVASGDQKAANNTLETWLGRCVHDGSLPSTGFEANVMPTQGDVFIKMVEDVCGMFAMSGATITSQCGLHIHVDARDYDHMDVRKLVKLYEKAEIALFACLPKGRHNNRFCQPCGFRFASHLRKGSILGPKDVAADGKVKHDLRKPIQSMVYGKSGRVERGSKYGPGEARLVRYMGLNLYSWYYRGSVEFRHAPGSIDPQYIINWALLCGGLLDTAMAQSERSIDAMGGCVLNELIESGEDLYKYYYTKNQSEEILKASTEVLKASSQERCWNFVDSLQEQYKGELELKVGKEKGSKSNRPNLGDTIDWSQVTWSGGGPL